ncbi:MULTISPECIES: hypothetical protein [Bacteria]|uniref:hypothetical protein n=1 Tax=Bacteria TaxID=2 RepID=UPI0012AF9A56|nr:MULTISPECIES: hypothetical protein [Bacteria]MZI83157.1 hypothetical protein [Clostridium butyricum]MCQ4846762.1 hypothetical protein [Gordonibacter pamelaeae]MCQ4849760.1 hypothetical protein [Gordonibacter pamelaeae]MRZ30088.1 hypothetical protein [Paeniclostridium sordellii]MRZ90337.1 hypothetical protein [Odoribacter splanchnicus]
MKGLSLRKKLGVFLSAILLSACLLLAGCGGTSYEGTWYCIKNNGELETLTLDKNGTCYYSNGYSFNWEKIDGGFTVSNGLGGDTFLDGDSGSVSKVTEFDEQTYYKDQAKAQEAFDGKVAEANAQKDAYIERATSQLVGTWYGEKEPAAYMKEKYPEIGSDTCTATFNEDGTYSMVDTSFNEQYVSVFERQLGQTSRTTTGIWSINYIEPENKTKFFDENVRVTMTGEDEQGKETSSPGIRMAGDGSDVSVTYTMKLEKK